MTYCYLKLPSSRTNSKSNIKATIQSDTQRWFKSRKKVLMTVQTRCLTADFSSKVLLALRSCRCQKDIYSFLCEEQITICRRPSLKNKLLVFQVQAIITGRPNRSSHLQQRRQKEIYTEKEGKHMRHMRETWHSTWPMRTNNTWEQIVHVFAVSAWNTWFSQSCKNILLYCIQ